MLVNTGGGSIPSPPPTPTPRVMYPRVKSWAFPRKGFRPTTRHLVGGLHGRRSITRRGFLRGFSTRGLRPNLPHAALILGGLERGCFARRLIRLGETAASSPSFGSSPGRSVRGRITPARIDGRIWPINTTMRKAPTEAKRTDSETAAGNCTTAGWHHVGFLPRLKS